MSSQGNSVGGAERGSRALDKTVVKKNISDGRTDELSGYIFDATTAQQPNQYERTVKELARFVGSTYKQGSDIKRTIKY